MGNRLNRQRTLTHVPSNSKNTSHLKRNILGTLLDLENKEKLFTKFDLIDYSDDVERETITCNNGHSHISMKGKDPYAGIKYADGVDEDLLPSSRAPPSYPSRSRAFSGRIHELPGERERLILEVINSYVRYILKCNLENITDLGLVDLILATFYKKSTLKRQWEQSEMPLFSALIIVYIANLMRTYYSENHEPSISEQFKAIKNDFDQISYDLLEHCYMNDEQMAHESLRINYQQLLHEENDEDEYEKLSLMDLASLGKAQLFLSHSCCQHEIDGRWKIDFRSSKISFFFAFLFPFIMRDSRFIKFRGRESFSQRIFKFYSSPSSKYAVHTLFYFFYILFYTFVLLRMSMRQSKDNVWYQLTLLGWQVSFIFEMCFEWTQKPRNISYRENMQLWASKHPVSHWQNIIIGLNIAVFILAAVPMSVPSFFGERHRPFQLLGVFALPIGECLFYMSFVLSTLRMLRVFAVDAFFGAIVMIIKKMTNILASFMVIFFAFWFIYAICQISLRGTDGPYYSIIWLIFSNGAFEIFGEPADELKEGQIVNCTNGPFDWNNITDQSVQCFFKSTMIPLVLFVYLMVASILIVNILTAFINQTYEEVDANAHLHWRYKKYSRLAEYEQRCWFPPPLSIFYIGYRIVRHVIFCILPSEETRKGEYNFKSHPANLDALPMRACSQEEGVVLKKRTSIYPSTLARDMLNITVNCSEMDVLDYIKRQRNRMVNGDEDFNPLRKKKMRTLRNLNLPNRRDRRERRNSE